MADFDIDPVSLIRPRRKITGISAILLPFEAPGEIDWTSFEAHVARTAEAGLTPAVNMDTGYVNLLDEATRGDVLQKTRSILGDGPFVAGAFVGDQPGAGVRSGCLPHRDRRHHLCRRNAGHLSVIRADRAGGRGDRRQLRPNRQLLRAVHRIRTG